MNNVEQNEDTDVDLPSIEIRPKKKDVDALDSALDAFNSEATDLPESVNEMNHVDQNDENNCIPVSVNEMNNVQQNDESEAKTVSDNEMNHVDQKDENEPIPVSVNEMNHVGQKDKTQNISSQETNHIVESGQSVGERSSQNQESTEMHQDSSAEMNHDQSQGEGDTTIDYITEKEVKEENKKIDLSVSCKAEIKDVVKTEEKKSNKSPQNRI